MPVKWKQLPLLGLLALTGCFLDQPPAALMTNRPMRIDVDTRPGPLVNPPPQRPQGRVDPDDTRPSRAKIFGPQSNINFGPSKNELAALEASIHAFAAKTGNANTFLALAPRKKARTSRSNAAAASDSADSDPDAPDAITEADLIGSGAHPESDNGFRLNFEDAEIKDVLQAVLGQTLGLNYTIASGVTGRISISSASPQTREELLSTLETVLALQGLSMTKSGSVYRIAPATIGSGPVEVNKATPGYGISVVPLRYSSVTSVSKLLSGFLTEADGIRIDTSLNAIIVRGPGARREELVRAIKTFDRDWMHTQAVSVIELRRSKPEEVISELVRIFDTDQNGNGNGVIQFKAIKRMRAIMVISQNPNLVRRAVAWIRRLDHHDASQTDAVFVYRPRYRDAKEMVRVVNNLFGSGGSSSSSSSSLDNNDSPSQSRGKSNDSSGAHYGSGNSSVAFAGSLNNSGLGNSTQGSSGAGGFGSGMGNASTGGGGGGGMAMGAAAAGGGHQQSGEANDLLDDSKNGGGDASHLKLVADTSNNSIIAYTTGETYQKVKSILTQLDVPPLQVAINVVIAEVQLTDELKYGVEVYLRNHTGSIGLTSAAATTLSRYLPGANLVLGKATSPEVVISALDSVSKVHILSTPSVVVMENKSANFEVGNQVPVITQQAQSNTAPDAPTVNSVNYVDTGIILKIVPRVGQDGSVVMDLDQIISSVVQDATSASSGSNALTPTISKRHIASDISVRSGQTVLLAGLINDNRGNTRGQLPWIGEQLGNIFGNTDNQYKRDELVIFINPVIIRDGMDAAVESQKFQERLKHIREPVMEKRP